MRLKETIVGWRGEPPPPSSCSGESSAHFHRDPGAFYIVRARVHTFLRASPDTIHSNLANSADELYYAWRSDRNIFAPRCKFSFPIEKKTIRSDFSLSLSIYLGYKLGEMYIYIYIARMRNSLELHETFRRSYVTSIRGRNILSSLEIFLFLRNLWNARRERYTKISNFSARKAGRQAGRPGRGLVVKLHAANV